MKAQTAPILFALLGSAVADDWGWGWFGGDDNDDLSCARDCRNSIDQPRATSLCAASLSSCISSACATGDASSAYARFASSTSALCSVYDNCGSGRTQTVTATDDDHTRTATVTGCPTGRDDDGWGWGSWGWNDNGKDHDGDDDDDDDDDGDDMRDWCNDWDCSATGRPATVPVTRDGTTTMAVETNTVVVAESGSVTRTTTFAADRAAATGGDGDTGAGADLRAPLCGALLGLVVAVAGIM